MDMQRDVEAGETTSMIKGIKSDSARRPTLEDVDLDIQKGQTQGDGVSVFLCCLCCIPAKTKKKTYFPEPRYCTDLLFALLWFTTFCLGIGAFLQVLTWKGPQGLSNDVRDAFKFLTPRQRAQWVNITMAALSTTIIGLGAVYMLLKHCPECYLRYCALFVISFFAMIGIVSENILCLLLVAAMVCVLYTFREKIPVTLQIMKIGMKALDKHIGVLCVGFLAIFMHVVWFAVCSILYVSLHRQKLEVTNPSLYLFCLCCLCFYYVWTAEIIRYVVDYVASATVASWVCFDSNNLEVRNKYLNANPRHHAQANFPVLNGIKHAFFTNIGKSEYCYMTNSYSFSII